jgi:hypothetical protein
MEQRSDQCHSLLGEYIRLAKLTSSDAHKLLVVHDVDIAKDAVPFVFADRVQRRQDDLRQEVKNEFSLKSTVIDEVQRRSIPYGLQRRYIRTYFGRQKRFAEARLRIAASQ